MSYDLSLRDPKTGQTAIVPDGHDLRGGNYRVDGNDEAWLNITFNYAPHFVRVLGEKGIRSIYGMTGRQSIPVLTTAINALKNDAAADYWAPTEGNARRALENLRSLAAGCPDAIWIGN